jgi:hypothetical protein
LSTFESWHIIGFERDIKPLFRERDRESMLQVRQFDLWSYDDVRANAQAILRVVEEGQMPCDGAWPTDRVVAFRHWAQTGMAP